MRTKRQRKEEGTRGGKELRNEGRTLRESHVWDKKEREVENKVGDRKKRKDGKRKGRKEGRKEGSKKGETG